MPNDTPILRLVTTQAAQVAKIDADNLAQVSRAYQRMYGRLEGRIDALRLAIEAVPSPTVAQIRKLPEYKALMRDAETELQQFQGYMGTMLEQAAEDGITSGLSHSSQLISAMTGGPFGGLRSNVVGPLLNYLRRDGPLYARLAQITYATHTGVSEKIIEGVSLGRNPRTIARAIQDAFGGGLTDALRNTRTVQLYSYRDSARANYMASGVVEGWVWSAHLDGLTCGACMAEHGTIHPLSEHIFGHYNCRCAALPYIPEFGNSIEQTGEQWFNSLPEAQQRAALGSAKYDALKAGKFQFSQLSQVQDTPVYGPMKSEASLKSLIGEQ
jgi:hypothetical protein